MVAIPSMGYTIERIMSKPSRSGIFLPAETIDEIAADAHDTVQAYIDDDQEWNDGGKTSDVVAVLDLEGVLPREALAAKVGAGISTLTPIIGRLKAAGLVEDGATIRHPGPGRPRTLIRVTQEMASAVEENSQWQTASRLARLADRRGISLAEAKLLAVSLGLRALEPHEVIGESEPPTTIGWTAGEHDD